MMPMLAVSFIAAHFTMWHRQPYRWGWRLAAEFSTARRRSLPSARERDREDQPSDHRHGGYWSAFSRLMTAISSTADVTNAPPKITNCPVLRKIAAPVANMIE